MLIVQTILSVESPLVHTISHYEQIANNLKLITTEQIEQNLSLPCS